MSKKLDKEIPETYRSHRIKLGVKDSLQKTIEHYANRGVPEHKVRKVLGFKEGLQMKTFKEFLIEMNEQYECSECGDKANSTDKNCWCGANKWVELDPEPPEHYGEPDVGTAERTRDIKPR